jgi:hypothetical protein
VILTACFRHSSRQLGIAKRAAERKQATGSPHGERRQPVAGRCSDERGYGEDSRADHIGYYKRGGRPYSQGAVQAGARGVGNQRLINSHLFFSHKTAFSFQFSVFSFQFSVVVRNHTTEN